MPKKTDTPPTYIVANPRGIPAEIDGERIPIFGQGERRWFEGDIYDGDSPDEPLRRGFIVPKGGD